MISQEQDQICNAWDNISKGYDEFVTSTHMWLGNEGIRRAGLQKGQQFLDIAAGSGALSIPAARLGANVLSVDISPMMLQQLETRARHEKLSIKIQVMDGHALEFDDNSFDVVGSQFGVMLFPDMPRAIKEMVRVAKHGGRVLLTVYGNPEEIEFFRFFVSAIQVAIPSFSGPSMDPPPLPFQLQNPEKLRNEMISAGLTQVRIETITEQLQFESGKQLWSWLINSNPIVAHVLDELELTADHLGLVHRTLEEKIRERAGDKKIAVLTNPIHIGVGIK